MYLLIWSLATFIIILLVFQFRYHLKLALALVVLLVALALGNPQPWPIYRGEVISHYLINDKSIILWIKHPLLPWPTSIAMPWDEEAAKELSDEQYQLGKHKLQYEGTLEFRKQPLVKRLPPPKLPDKPVTREKPMEFEQGA